MSHFPNYKQWRDAIEKMTPEDVLTGEMPGDTPVYANILLEKLRVKFSGLTSEQLSVCREAIEKYRQNAEKREREMIEYNARRRIEQCQYAAERGVKRAEEEAFSKKLSELGIPSFVTSDGPDAPAKLLCLVNMPKRGRLKYIERAMNTSRCAQCQEDECSGCIYEEEDHSPLCLSEWKWIQREAERCMQCKEKKDE